MDGSRGVDFDQSPESEVHDWRSYFQRLIDTVPRPNPVSGTLSPTRLKARRNSASEYHLSEFISVVTSYFKAVRTCLIAQDKQHIIAHFEANVSAAETDLKHNLFNQPASTRCRYAIDVLAHAMRNVKYLWLKDRQLFHGRTQVDDLVVGLRRLENLGAPPSETKTIIAPVTALPAVRRIVAEPSGLVDPYRSSAFMVTSPRLKARTFPYSRYALGAIFASASIGYAVYAGPSTEARSFNAAHYSESRVRARREASPINHEIEFFRHTVDIVDPVKPHTSVVIHTLETAFARYPTQLSRCYIPSNPLAVHSSSELAHYVADHPQRSAHNLIQRVSRRRHDRTITIWWTENCHEIVIAPGVQTTFATNIRPSPVTILFTPPHP